VYGFDLVQELEPGRPVKLIVDYSGVKAHARHGGVEFVLVACVSDINRTKVIPELPKQQIPVARIVVNKKQAERPQDPCVERAVQIVTSPMFFTSFT
jgi:hypothetical protein